MSENMFPINCTLEEMEEFIYPHLRKLMGEEWEKWHPSDNGFVIEEESEESKTNDIHLRVEKLGLYVIAIMPTWSEISSTMWLKGSLEEFDKEFIRVITNYREELEDEDE